MKTNLKMTPQEEIEYQALKHSHRLPSVETFSTRLWIILGQSFIVRKS